MRIPLLLPACVIALGACRGGPYPPAEPPDPAETVIGERLFRETRFAQFFFARENGVNRPLGFGDGTFAALLVATLPERNMAPDASLPPSEAHPLASGRFLGVPSAAEPGVTDLGLRNVFANPDVPRPQAALRLAILAQLGLPDTTTDDDLLPLTIAWFKTPGLRDLSHGAPYFHTGQADSLEDVLDHYTRFSALARTDDVRNAAPELSGIALVEADAAPLAAFLRALNEDYE